MMVDEYILLDRTVHFIHVVRVSFDLKLRIVDVDSYTEGTYRGSEYAPTLSVSALPFVFIPLVFTPSCLCMHACVTMNSCW